MQTKTQFDLHSNCLQAAIATGNEEAVSDALIIAAEAFGYGEITAGEFDELNQDAEEAGYNYAAAI
jgi:hypothetical protein